MHSHSRQPIKHTSFGLAGQSVYAKMPLPQQPTELIYCAAPACIPKAKLEYIRRRRSRTEDNRPQAREQGPQLYAISSSLVLATEHVLSHYDCTIYYHRWVHHAPLTLRSWPVHPAWLFRSDSQRLRRTDTTSCQHGVNGDCIDKENCKGSLIFPSLESNAKRASVLSARAPRYRRDLMLSITPT
ncbi:unnamed protein product [Penicillium salamii]|uniref:Uncharacterized protein n=2 Tax=Penicillium salamii TaxID=1612424 RepID=A0A9W4N6P6_9EURO|nr:unnamed protein product [Penicillium salamii]